jgi:glycerate 2-kinase
MAMMAGVLQADDSADVNTLPVSDGGDGLIEAVRAALPGTIMQCDVRGPLPGQRVKAHWFRAADGETAVIEMAEAAGLLLVPAHRRNPAITTTYGVGELMRNVALAGVRRAIIGIGGSATNDGGAGMAQALGIRLRDASGKDLPPGGASLRSLDRIEMDEMDSAVRSVEWIVASDVTSPVCGPHGASLVYSPQKGASREDVVLLEEGLCHFLDLIERKRGEPVRDVPGTGAAGGLGAGLLAFCGATIRPGIDIVLDMIRYDRQMTETDVVLTGEGRLDAQTGFGKAVHGVVRRSQRHGKPVLGVFGQIDDQLRPEKIHKSFLAVDTLVDDSTSPDEAIRNAGLLLQMRTERLFSRYRNSPV